MWKIVLRTLGAFAAIFFIVWASTKDAPAQEGVCEKSSSVVKYVLKEPTRTEGLFAQISDPDKILAIKNRLVEVGKLSSVADVNWQSIDIFVPKKGQQEGMLFVVLYDENGCAIRGFWDNETAVLDYLTAALGRRI